MFFQCFSKILKFSICFSILPGTLIDVRASKQLLNTLQQLGRASSHSSDETFAHVCITVGQIRWVNVCGAALKGVANHSRGILSEMRAARDFHTVSRTPHHLCARAGQEDAGLANVLTNAVAYAFLRERKSHTSILFEAAVPLPGLAKSCSGLTDHDVHSVRAFLHCDIRASLYDCWA